MIWFLILAFALLLGLILLLRGWCGRRIDDHPLCRACGYDLIASDLAAKCPECGRDVSTPRSVRIGHRRVRRASLVLGSVLLLASLGGGGVMVWSTASHFDWYPYKPLWLLRMDATSTNPSKAIASQSEILDRLNAGKLSASQIESIITEALTAQADLSKTWFGWWGDFIEMGWQAGVVSEQTIIQYARTAIEMSYSMQIPPRVREGAMVTIWHSHAPMRSGRSGLLSADIEFGEITFDDGAQVMRISSQGLTTISSGSRGRSGSGFRMQLPAGKHIAKSEMTVRILPTRRMLIPMIAREGRDPVPAVDALATFTIPLTTAFEVVPRDADVVERVQDAALSPTIQNAASVRALVAAVTSRGVELMCEVEINDPPMPVAFDVFVRIGEEEWRMRPVTASPEDHFTGQGVTMGGTSSTLLLRDFPAGADEVDVVLRPNVEVAERAGLARIWDGEIVLQNVPVKWLRRR